MQIVLLQSNDMKLSVWLPTFRSDPVIQIEIEIESPNPSSFPIRATKLGWTKNLWHAQKLNLNVVVVFRSSANVLQFEVRSSTIIVTSVLC